MADIIEMENVHKIEELDEDKEFKEFLKKIQEDSIEGFFVTQNKDGTTSFMTTSKTLGDMIVQAYTVNEFLKSLIDRRLMGDE